MANGTGVTRGPFALSFGTSLNATDPNANGGQPSDRVQIQNESAFSLSILSSGAPYTIPAFQASTIPTLNGGQSTLEAQGYACLPAWSAREAFDCILRYLGID
jgi:hypothetical protein